MNATEARDMLNASLEHPDLVTQVVPAPLTLAWDATIQCIISEGTLGDLNYIDVRQVFQMTVPAPRLVSPDSNVLFLVGLIWIRQAVLEPKWFEKIASLHTSRH